MTDIKIESTWRIDRVAKEPDWKSGKAATPRGFESHVLRQRKRQRKLSFLLWWNGTEPEAVKCHALKRCTSDMGPTNRVNFRGVRSPRAEAWGEAPVEPRAASGPKANSSELRKKDLRSKAGRVPCPPPIKTLKNQRLRPLVFLLYYIYTTFLIGFNRRVPLNHLTWWFCDTPNHSLGDMLITSSWLATNNLFCSLICNQHKPCYSWFGTVLSTFFQ